jgi:peptidoglycan/LPS O-acetylase OafA/YrhL
MNHNLTAYTFVGLARRREYATLLKSLSSSVLRRWMRLMFPALASSFIGFLLTRTGLAHNLYSDWESHMPQDPSNAERIVVEARLPDPGDATFQRWVDDSLQMVDPFEFGAFRFPTFNFPLWTMQVEFLGSMLVFVLVLAVAFVRPAFRIGIPSTLVAFCLWSGRWHWSLFISGMVLAELSYRRSLHQPVLPIDTTVEEIAEESKESTPLPLSQNSVLYLPYLTAFLFACYIGTYPEYDPGSSPGYRWLSLYVPTRWAWFGGYFYPVLGSLLLVAILEHGKFLQKIFTTQIAQYLGDISLSMYMLHTQVELSLGNWLVPVSLNFARSSGDYYFAIGMCCESMTSL